MKTKYYLVAIASCLLLAFASCKKDNANAQNNLIVGKWYVSKINVKQQNVATASNPTIDTTYLSSNFTVNDYFSFYSNNVSDISGNGTFFPGHDIIKTTTGGEVPYSYTVKGSALTLKSLWLPTCPANPGGPAGCDIPVFTETILKLDSHNLVIQDVLQLQNPNFKTQNLTYKTITETYYTR